VEVKTETKIKRGFMNFLKNYNVGRAVVFDSKEFKSEKIGDTQVIFFPHFFI